MAAVCEHVALMGDDIHGPFDHEVLRGVDAVDQGQEVIPGFGAGTGGQHDIAVGLVATDVHLIAVEPKFARQARGEGGPCPPYPPLPETKIVP